MVRVARRTARLPARLAARLPALRAALVVVALASAGCGVPPAPGGPSASGSGPVPASEPVQFLVFGDPEEIQAYRDIIEAFRAIEPGIPVQLIEASDRTDLLTRLSTSFAGGRPPDVFLINYRFYAQFAARGVLEALGDRMAASATLADSEFFGEALVPFQFGGRQICLPQNISSLVVYYNRDLFQAEGVTEPEPGWQWRGMVEKAQALTKDLDGDGMAEQYGLGIDPILIRLAPFLWSAGAELIDDPERPTRLALDTPEAQRVLSSFFALRLANGVIPSDIERESEDDESRFLNGRTAMFLDSRRATPILRATSAFDWDVAPLPVFGRESSILHSDAYCMAAASRQKDATWRFIEFALGPEGQRLAAATGRTVPSIRSVAESRAFLDPGAKPANSRVWLDIVPTLRSVPAISTWPEIEDATSPILEAAMFGEVPPGDLAQLLDDATRGIFARAEYGD